MMTKAELRATFLAQRRALSVAQAEHLSRHMLKPLMHLLCSDIQLFNKPKEFGKSAYIHTFLPIDHQREVDTWYFVRWAWRGYKTIKIAASVTDPVRKKLTHYRIRPDTVFTKNRWGIPEPQSAARPVSSATFDIVLVPLLAFDQQGNRVGYGGGYYDRFLAECRPDCVKIGLSLFDPVERIDDVEPTDVRLDACITPEEVCLFK